jgi:hypothetical protein
MQVPAREHELSTRLNRLIGEANCEAALLPTRRTISEWTSEEVHEGVIRCQRAVIATLRCANELQALDSLDGYSRLWIREALEKCEEHLQSLELIQNACGSSALEDG